MGEYDNDPLWGSGWPLPADDSALRLSVEDLSNPSILGIAEPDWLDRAVAAEQALREGHYAWPPPGGQGAGSITEDPSDNGAAAGPPAGSWSASQDPSLPPSLDGNHASGAGQPLYDRLPPKPGEPGFDDPSQPPERAAEPQPSAPQRPLAAWPPLPQSGWATLPDATKTTGGWPPAPTMGSGPPPFSGPNALAPGWGNPPPPAALPAIADNSPAGGPPIETSPRPQGIARGLVRLPFGQESWVNLTRPYDGEVPWAEWERQNWVDIGNAAEAALMAQAARSAGSPALSAQTAPQVEQPVAPPQPAPADLQPGAGRPPLGAPGFWEPYRAAGSTPAPATGPGLTFGDAVNLDRFLAARTASSTASPPGQPATHWNGTGTSGSDVATSIQSLGQSAGALGLGLGQGLSFGFGPEVVALFRTVGGPPGSYARELARLEANYRAVQAGHPVATALGEFGGTLLSPFARIGAAAKGAGFAGRLIGGARQGAVSGALWGAGTTDGSLADRAEAGLEAVPTSAVLGTAMALIPGFRGRPPSGGKNLVHVFDGPPPTAGGGQLMGDLAHLSTDAERTAARDLVQRGHIVEIPPPRQAVAGQRSSDFFVDGVQTELKSPSRIVRTDSNGISSALAANILDARGQSPHVLVDARGQKGMTDEIATRAIERARGRDKQLGAKLKSIAIWTPGGKFITRSFP